MRFGARPAWQSTDSQKLLRQTLLAVVLSLASTARAQTAVCGNGIVEGTEQCDAGSANGTSASCCSATCTFSSGTPCTDTTPGDCFQAVCSVGACRQDGPAQPTGTSCTPATALPECVLAQCSGTACGTIAPPGTACTLASPNECLLAQCVGGTPTCGVPKAGGTRCTDTTPGDCLQAVCITGTCNQMGPAQPSGTSCTPASALPACVLAQCNGPECGTIAPSGTVCADATPGDCFAAQCNGTGSTCPSIESPQPAGAACGDPTATQCNNPDTCNGSGQCQSNFARAGTGCTDTVPTNCFAARVMAAAHATRWAPALRARRPRCQLGALRCWQLRSVSRVG